jgi:hypothetical protein
VASGGIVTARALAAVLACGCGAARVGTRFVAAAESGAHPSEVGRQNLPDRGPYASDPRRLRLPRHPEPALGDDVLLDLRRAAAKTGISRQSELAALLARLAIFYPRPPAPSPTPLGREYAEAPRAP